MAVCVPINFWKTCKHEQPAERGCAGQVLTSDNVRALRDSIITLTRTMEHIEGISGDVGGLTGDAKVKQHVRQLVEALSRIVAD